MDQVHVGGRRAAERSELVEHAEGAVRESAPRLVLDKVTHRFGSLTALDRASLEVRRGEIVSLLGASGCGKTTLLRIAAGIERQTAGRVLVDEVELAGPGVFVPAEQRSLGLVFQDFALFPHLTVLQNAMYGIRGAGRREAQRAARLALQRVGLAQYEKAFPHALSGGEQQRVALVRALLPGPRVVLLDEPFSGLDPTLRSQVREDTIGLLRERGATAVIVTHDPQEALAISDRIALMRQGRVVQIGTPEEIYRNPVDLEAAHFFSDLALLHGVTTGGHVPTPLGAIAAPGYADQTRVLVALRPESLYMETGGTGIDARVESVRFRGDGYTVALRVPGVSALVRVYTRTAGAPRTGAVVRLRLEPRGALVFPEA